MTVGCMVGSRERGTGNPEWRAALRSAPAQGADAVVGGVDRACAFLGLGAQFDWLDPNLDQTSDIGWELEGELAWFVKARNIELKLRYAHIEQQTPETEEDDLPFATGSSNLLTLQLNVSF